MSLISRGKALVAAFQASPLGQFLKRYSDDRAGLLAAVVAHNALFSMFPLILGILSIIGLVLRDPDVRAQAQGAVVQGLPPEVQPSVLGVVEGTSQGAGVFALISLVGLLWGGSGLFGALEVAFGQFYRVPGRAFVRQKLMAFGMILLFAVLIVVSVAASSVAQIIGGLVAALGLGSEVAVVVGLVGTAISFAAAFGLAFAILYVVPNLHLTPRQVMPGALAAGVALVLLVQLFPLYVRYAASFNQYGALFGLFFLLMTWNYFVAQVLLLGAEINAFFRPPARRVEREALWPTQREGERPAA